MPELDPKWEYWTPDEEILELLNIETEKNFDSILNSRSSQEDFQGFRFGKGNPNRSKFRLAPEKSIPYKELKQKLCQGCKELFKPKRNRDLFCSKECYNKNYNWKELNKRTLPDRNCLFCHKLFRPIARIQVYCCMNCSNKGRTKIKEKNCLNCKKLFKPPRLITKFCCKDCSDQYRTGKEFDTGCKNCGKDIDISKKKYCSSSCKVICCNRRKAIKKRSNHVL